MPGQDYLVLLSKDFKSDIAIILNDHKEITFLNVETRYHLKKRGVI
jgi:hypothetical protein